MRRINYNTNKIAKDILLLNELRRMLVIGEVGLLLFLLMLLSSCNKDSKEPKQEKAYPVEVSLLKNTQKLRQIEYFGIVSSNVINYSFISGGRVEKIFVKKNQSIRKGTKLMQLETAGYKLALNAANNQKEQAKSAYREAKVYYDKLQKAWQNGGLSEADLEKAKLDRDIKQKSWEQSKIDVLAKTEHLKQATLYAKADGVVADILPQVGEMLGAGVETIIIKGEGIFIETTISQKDLDFINVRTPASVNVKDQLLKGKVSFIAGLPNMQTFRHTVKIDFPRSSNQQSLPIGMTAKVKFETETINGFWVPLHYISNDGNDFVYVVENNRMRKKKIQILDYSNELVRVSGLAENEQLITKGAYKIKEGYKVKIVGDAE